MGSRPVLFQLFSKNLINFDDTGLSVDEINSELRNRSTKCGRCIKRNSRIRVVLYCVTEVHTDEDIDKLVYNLKEIVS